jgi:hypothetical protein
VKFYENLRFVYEIQTQLRDWKQREQELKGRAATDDQQAAPRGRQGGDRAPQPAGGKDSRSR